MSKPTDIRPLGATLWFLPVRTRVPLKFGPETLTEVTCARVCVEVERRDGRRARGWGETPLSVQWVWPSSLPYRERFAVLERFTLRMRAVWTDPTLGWGHAIEVGHDVIAARLRAELDAFNRAERAGQEPMPWLAALVCASAFDLAIHDAYGIVNEIPIYRAYGREHLNRDLGDFLVDAEGKSERFRGRYPSDILKAQAPESLVAWHLVGGVDPITAADLRGDEPSDGHPVLLADWIERDGLKCLKVKLRGTDAAWDWERLLSVGEVAIAGGVDWLSADFNCTVTDPGYVDTILDRLRDEHPRLFGMLLYVEQPFPYELEEHSIDVHSVSARKPLFMDESAHDWQHVRLGRELGWSGVALKTCKTQTGALLSLCWARAHGMTLMVQDLTNPMLAQVPHVLLAAHAGTIMGVETNSMQFYPEASAAEAVVHPGLFQRRGGRVLLGSIEGPGFGYRIDEITRTLPPPAA